MMAVVELMTVTASHLCYAIAEEEEQTKGWQLYV